MEEVTGYLHYPHFIGCRNGVPGTELEKHFWGEVEQMLGLAGGSKTVSIQ